MGITCEHRVDEDRQVKRKRDEYHHGDEHEYEQQGEAGAPPKEAEA